MKNILIMCLLLTSLDAYSAQPMTSLVLDDTEASPKRTFTIEHYSNPTNECYQICLSDIHNPTNRALLYKYYRSATVLVSPNEKWIVVNDYSGSNTAEPVLFRREKGITFTQVKDVDLGDAAWRAAATNQGFSTEELFDHRYSEVLCWLGDSDQLILHAWGYYGGERSLNDWFCLYNAKTGKVSYDLSELNVNSYTLFNTKKKKANKPLRNTSQ